MKNIFLLLGILILVILFFGCVEPENVICEKVEVAKVLEKYPNIELISMGRLSEDNFEEEKEYWQDICEIEINSGSYYKAVYEEELVKIEVLAETSKLDIICIIENLKTPIIIEESSADINYVVPDGNLEKKCVENWDCSQWSDCKNNLQTRNCTELNGCENITIPITVRDCLVEEKCEATWVCFDWSECFNGVQTRECTEINGCDTNEIPETDQPC